MAKRWFWCLILLTALPLSRPALAGMCGDAGAIRAMTYNIRLDIAADGPNRWDARRDAFLGQIRLVRPDLLGLQEVVPGQYADLRAALPGYSFVGGGRDDGKGQGEASPLAINHKAFAIRDSGMFWLSPTPQVPSMGWDAAFRRVVTWAQLRRRSDGERLLVLNTHWDHVGRAARRNSALQIRQWVAAHRAGQQPVILLGDFNAPLEEASLASLLSAEGPPPAFRDARAAAREPVAAATVTFNAFDPLPKAGTVIDHILTSGRLGVARYHILAEHFDGRVASDHFPVIADLAPECGKPHQR